MPIWLSPYCARPRMTHCGLLLACLLTLLTGCRSAPGITCPAHRETLSGEPLGDIEGRIIDRVNSFILILPQLQLESGTLRSSDPARYIPSAVTRDGWLLQRISAQRFSAINAPQNMMMTFNCPLNPPH